MKHPEIPKRKSKLQSVETYEGESIEEKVKRILDTGEPIKDGAPLIFTDKKDGVLPEYDIRTDRFMVAIDAMDKVNSYKLSEYLKDGKELPEEKSTPNTEDNSSNAKPE